MRIKGLLPTAKSVLISPAKKFRWTGKVVDLVELLYALEGTLFSSVVIQLYNKVPRIEFKYRIAKTMSYAVENVFLPLALNTGCQSLYFDKGGVPFRPGIDQIPGTCMEYYIADSGLVYSGEKSALLIQQLDTALLSSGRIGFTLDYQTSIMLADIRLIRRSDCEINVRRCARRQSHLAFR